MTRTVLGAAIAALLTISHAAHADIDAQAPTSSISGGSKNVTTAVTQVLP
jgi:hypothetical protein